MVVAKAYFLPTGNEPIEPPTEDVKWRATRVEGHGWNIVLVYWQTV